MFNFFSKQKSGNVGSFSLQLAAVAADFNEITDHIDQGSAEILKSRAAEFHKERGENEAQFTAPDFYFYVFMDQMCLVTDKEFISPIQSARFWALTDAFLDKKSKYRTSVVTNGMNIWYEMLMRFGVV